VFAKPMVYPLEVGQPLDLMSRSRKDGLDIDHIPAQKALELALKRRIADLGGEEIQHFYAERPALQFLRGQRPPAY